jgi:hypothetical protein
MVIREDGLLLTSFLLAALLDSCRALRTNQIDRIVLHQAVALVALVAKAPLVFTVLHVVC